jgi:hypothetical protein
MFFKQSSKSIELILQKRERIFRLFCQKIITFDEKRSTSALSNWLFFLPAESVDQRAISNPYRLSGKKGVGLSQKLRAMLRLKGFTRFSSNFKARASHVT